MTTSWGGGITCGGISLRMLAARFPRFAFGTRRMRDGVSFEAVRQEDRDAPGVSVVITKDAGEMRRALLEDEEDRAADHDG